VAVNVTLVPAHILFCDTVILTDGVINGCTVIVIVFETAGTGVTQAALLVISTCTTSPLFNVAVE
jgi:hypothetical protein